MMMHFRINATPRDLFIFVIIMFFVTFCRFESVGLHVVV